ncbi:hypothetical protein LPU83_pLPU83b_0152 (plasmid) [Rhizobium favelukesii]|uniref:Uncharacterized protein n=1 Tax=Rhizobium favelukesii TaxID=348824 RepID=W6RMH9_9HYPH|nr:hypothetical protein LPU83_pLPU83b_0152 [Rhizobium favelukesii]
MTATSSKARRLGKGALAMAASTDLVPVASSATACTECSSGAQADDGGVIPFPRPRYEGHVEKEVRIQMSDGIALRRYLSSARGG